jgi:hypothetical protein
VALVPRPPAVPPVHEPSLAVSSAARPLTVTVAVWIAAAGLATAAILDVILTRDGIDYSGADGIHWMTVGGQILWLLFAVGIPAALLVALAFRRRWAWILFLLLNVLILAGDLRSARDTLTADWPWGAWNSGALALRLAVIALLLLPASWAWYRRTAGQARSA